MTLLKQRGWTRRPSVVPPDLSHPMIFILFYSIQPAPGRFQECATPARRTRPRAQAPPRPAGVARPVPALPLATRDPSRAAAPWRGGSASAGAVPAEGGTEAAPAGPAQGAFPRAAPAAAPSHAAGVPPSGARRGQAGERSPGELRDPSPLRPALRPVRPGQACGEGRIPVTAVRRELNDSARAGPDWLRSL